MTVHSEQTAACPRCGCACRVGLHYSANCVQCFHSFRVDAPERSLPAHEQPRMFDSPVPMAGQAEMFNPDRESER